MGCTAAVKPWITWNMAVRRALMMVMAPMNRSPPNMLSCRLATAWMTELVPWAMKLATPMLTIRPTIRPRRPMYFSRRGSTAFLERRNSVHHTALTTWESTVARAAPRTPM